MCISNLKFSAYICHRRFCFPFICFSYICPPVCPPLLFILSFFRSAFCLCTCQSAFSLFVFLSPTLSAYTLSIFLSVYLHVFLAFSLSSPLSIFHSVFYQIFFFPLNLPLHLICFFSLFLLSFLFIFLSVVCLSVFQQMCCDTKAYMRTLLEHVTLWLFVYLSVFNLILFKSYTPPSPLPIFLLSPNWTYFLFLIGPMRPTPPLKDIASSSIYRRSAKCQPIKTRIDCRAFLRKKQNNTHGHCVENHMFEVNTVLLK